MKKSWIIVRQGTARDHPGSEKRPVKLRMRHPPTYVHFTRASAIDELTRLSELNPGVDFMLFESLIQATGKVEVEIREPNDIETKDKDE